jgi:phenylacetate-coenzyme A ligase PaaK-like adenylate-forming protein
MDKHETIFVDGKSVSEEQLKELQEKQAKGQLRLKKENVNEYKTLKKLNG